ncbi:AP4A tetraphosphatase, partial [Polyodon spathula]|nr:AP4A tetraphosphatase [Polyodon spathula]
MTNQNCKTDGRVLSVFNQVRFSKVIGAYDSGTGVRYCVILGARRTASSVSLYPGHVDPGEDDLQTALRETQEEAGLGVEHFRILEGYRKELRYMVNSQPKTVVYWLAELCDSSTSVRLSEEHQDYRWLGVEEACQLSEYKDLQEALREAHSFVLNRQEPL